METRIGAGARATADASISRRGLIRTGVAAGMVAAIGPRGAFAADAEAKLKVGFVSPRTGALAGFGETDGYVLELVRKALAGGLKVGDKTYAVDILDRDTQSDPARAGPALGDSGVSTHAHGLASFCASRV